LIPTHVFVFLNKKLISCDLVTPFLFELKKRFPDIEIEIFIPDFSTFKIISQNRILFDAVSQSGNLRVLGTKQSGLIALSMARLKRLAVYAKLAFLMLTSGAKIIHFKALNSWPTKAIYYVKPKSVFLFQSSEKSVSDADLEVQSVMQRDNLNFDGGVSPQSPVAGKIVGFDEKWRVFADKRCSGIPQTLIGPPSRRKIWHDYLQTRAADDFAKEGIDRNKKYAVYILSSLPDLTYFKNKNAGLELVPETLSIISNIAPDLTIIVKTHPATTPERLAEILSSIKTVENPNIVVANIHPTTLAQNAVFFIGNGFSTTFLTARNCNVPTVEYTEYSDEIAEITGGKAMRPDDVTHFIRRNPQALGAVISEILTEINDRPSSEFLADKNYEDLLVELAS
jgi:hypothetical protein